MHVHFYPNVTTSRYVRVYAVAYPSVVCPWSVTFVRPTPPVEIYGKVSTPLCITSIR